MAKQGIFSRVGESARGHAPAIWIRPGVITAGRSTRYGTGTRRRVECVDCFGSVVAEETITGLKD